jgi:hypothetical protein
MVTPLVHEDQIRVAHRRRRVERPKLIFHAFQARIHVAKTLERLISVLCAKILRAPGIGRFENGDVMATVLQLSDDTTQEMRVPVIPVGLQRMIKKSDLHTSASVSSYALTLRPRCSWAYNSK